MAAAAVAVTTGLGSLAAVLPVGDAPLAAASSGAGPAAPPASSSTSPSPSDSPSPPPLHVSRLADIRVHRYERASFRARILGRSGARASVVLVVVDADGRQVLTRRLARSVAAGTLVEARLAIRLRRGRYSYGMRLEPPCASPAVPPLRSPTPSATTAPTPVGTPSPAATASPMDVPTPTPTATPLPSPTARLTVLRPLPPGFPGAKAVAAAERWARGRPGEVAFAVVDSNGKVAGGYRVHRRFQLASLAKAILLVASLRRDPTPDVGTRATLTLMITRSDNASAFAINRRVGNRGMTAVAKLAGMRDYVQGATWLETRASAWDQARFFWQLEKLVPREGRKLARSLLSGIVAYQRWGIPSAAGPAGWQTYFKGGWLGYRNELMTQAAWLKKGDRRWALAVLTEKNPTRVDGWNTQKGITGLLLGRRPTAAYLADVLE